MDKIRVSAKTMEEAITKATIQLQTTSDRISYTVLVQGSKGILGIGAKPWIIEAFVKEEAEIALEEKKEAASFVEKKQVELKKEEKAEEKTGNQVNAENKKEEKEVLPKDKKATKKTTEAYKGFSRGGYDPIPAPREEKRERRENKAFSDTKSTEEAVEKKEFHALTAEEIAENKEKAKQFLNSILTGMDMQVELEIDFHAENNELYINIVGPDMGILIGKRGQTLDSLQYLCSLVLNKDHKEDYLRVKLDTEDYRKRREQTLRSLAKNIAYKVKKTKKSVNLEPMNPYERRIIHASLQNDSQVSTRSEGDDPFRHVVIFFKNGGKFRQDRRFKNKYPKENRAEK